MQELESECLKPGPSEKLAQIGLALLKHVSSHKGLTYAANMFCFCLSASDRNSVSLSLMSTRAANTLRKRPNETLSARKRSPTSSTTSTYSPRFVCCSSFRYGP
jgi:hypothetical protein